MLKFLEISKIKLDIIRRISHVLNDRAIVYCSLICGIFVLSPKLVVSQNESPELKERIVQLALFKNADNRRTAEAKVRQEGFKERMVAGSDVKIKFYALKDSIWIFLKEATTGADGKAEILLPDPVPLDSAGNINIRIKSIEDAEYTASEEEMSILDCTLSTKIFERDSMRYVTSLVKSIDSDGQYFEEEDIEVSFYVKRLFGLMPISEDHRVYSDENGISEIQFPDNIKGDVSGDITIVIRVEDDDYFGNLENRIDVNWGIPITIEENPFPRALWMPRAPLKLMIVFSIIFGAIWGLYFYVMYLLKGLKEESNLN